MQGMGAVRGILGAVAPAPLRHGVAAEVIDLGQFLVGDRGRLCLQLPTDRRGGSCVFVKLDIHAA